MWRADGHPCTRPIAKTGVAPAAAAVTAHVLEHRYAVDFDGNACGAACGSVSYLPGAWRPLATSERNASRSHSQLCEHDVCFFGMAASVWGAAARAMIAAAFKGQAICRALHDTTTDQKNTSNTRAHACVGTQVRCWEHGTQSHARSDLDHQSLHAKVGPFSAGCARLMAIVRAPTRGFRMTSVACTIARTHIHRFGGGVHL